MTPHINKLALCGLIAMGLTAQSQAQTLLYSVNGTGGSGGGSSGVTTTPSTAPAGSSALTTLGGTANLSFGTGPGGVAGESIVNAAAGQSGNEDFSGTLGASSLLTAFTLTMWVQLSPTAVTNNYRLAEISPGSPATTGTADGTKLFFGLNSGGGLQAYVNNVNGNSVATDIATAGTWNDGGTLGGLTPGKWYFEAITYDTVGATSTLYSGDVNDAAVSAYTYNNLTGGTLDLSAATSISLLDRFSGSRDFPGAIDDVNIFNGALTVGQLDTLQNSEVPTPEPATATLAGLGSLVGVLMLRRRR